MENKALPEGERFENEGLNTDVAKLQRSIVECSICSKKGLTNNPEEWYKEHNREHKYIPRYKGDKRRVYCLTCKESCYPSLEGKVPESKEELDIWYNIHSSLFHKNEEPIPLGRSPRTRVLGLSPNVERLYKCDICNALHREKSNIEKHLKYLHKKKVESLEPIEIDYSKREDRKSYDYGLVIDKKSKKSIVSLVKEGDNIKCMHCGKRYSNMLVLTDHIKAFSNTNAKDWVIENARDLLSFF